MGPSRHSRGTNANQPQATHQPPHRHPRSTTHQRSLPKTAPDAHAARPADDQATASPAATHDQPYEPSLLPLQLLTLETLRRPFESASFSSVTVMVTEIEALKPDGSVALTVNVYRSLDS